MTSSIDKFNKWIASFSGCDGGSPDANTWFCGIEWGMPKEYIDKSNRNSIRYYDDVLKHEIEGGYYKPADKYVMQKEMYYPYGRSLAKLYAAINGEPVDKYIQFAEKTVDNEIFKMNLYPIPFPNVADELWQQHGLDKLTGLQSKQIYRTWCFLHRFPYISSQVKERSPKLIVATGITYLTDFVVCFAGSGGIDNINMESLSCESDSNKAKRTYYWTKINNRTTLVVIPFFGGPNGLNSDFLLGEIGKRIRQIKEQGN